MENNVQFFLENFKIQIENNLKAELVISTNNCKGRCINGKLCSLRALPFSDYCKKHKGSTENRNIKTLLYHNHLPGVYVKGCPACYTVGINS